FENTLKPFQWIKGQWKQEFVPVEMSYRRFPYDLVANLWGYRFDKMTGMTRLAVPPPPTATAPAESLALGVATRGMAAEGAVAFAADSANAYFAKAGEANLVGANTPAVTPKGPDLSQVTARKNLNETAFFFPQLISDRDGVVKLQFTMPEALTEWRFLGFAHDKKLRSGFLEDKAVTSKDLMVQPNPPRFVREGDVLEF